jgi:hypothetical protein
MSPGGHLVTTAAACAGTLAVTGSVELTAAIAVGGFLIDVDHAIDYVLFEKQRDLRPGAFLRYYLDGRVKIAVLALHSYELFALIALAGWWTGSAILQGYLMGALLHLALDITFNGEYRPRSISAFYSFTYRLAHGFRMADLLGPLDRVVLPDGFWATFFRGPSLAPKNASDGVDDQREATSSSGIVGSPRRKRSTTSPASAAASTSPSGPVSASAR